MRIRAIVIEGVKGQVEITRTEAGAHVTTGEFNQVLVEVARDEHPEARYAKAREVAAVLSGTRVVGFYGMTPHSDVQLADGRILKIANRHLAAPARASRRATR